MLENGKLSTICFVYLIFYRTIIQKNYPYALVVSLKNVNGLGMGMGLNFSAR
jgi:hypothetical protein